MKKSLFFIALAMYLPILSFAITITWSGAVDSDWHNAANWSPAQVPTTNDDVQVTSNPSSVNIDITINAFARSLRFDGMTIYLNAVLDVSNNVPGTTSSLILQNGSNLTTWSTNASVQVKGNLLIQNSSFSHNGGLILNGELPYTTAHLRIEDFSTFLINPGGFVYAYNNIETGGNEHLAVSILMNNTSELYNYGSIQLAYDSASDDYIDNGIIINNKSKLYNYGFIQLKEVKDYGFEIQNGALGLPFSELENHGIIDITGCFSCGGGGVGLGVGQHGKFFDNPGPPATYGLVFNNLNTNMWNSSCLVFNAPPASPFSLVSTNFTQLSTLAGNGPTMNGGSMIQGAISPGFSPGIIEFLDPFSVTAPTQFIMELAGIDGAGASTGHDQIKFSSTPNDLTDVSLKVEFIDGFIPNVGNTFTIIDGSYTGTFTSIDFPGDDSNWTVNYNATDITIELITEVTNYNNVGIGISDPQAKLHVESGDIFVSTLGAGIIVKDANGDCHRITVDAAGVITAPIVACPQ